MKKKIVLIFVSANRILTVFRSALTFIWNEILNSVLTEVQESDKL